MISTGYFPYAQYVRDYNPPSTPMMQPGGGPPGTPSQQQLHAGPDSPMYSTIPNKRQPTSLLNVTDPRYSATYGNPLLRQVKFISYNIVFFLDVLPGMSRLLIRIQKLSSVLFDYFHLTKFLHFREFKLAGLRKL